MPPDKQGEDGEDKPPDEIHINVGAQAEDAPSVASSRDASSRDPVGTRWDEDLALKKGVEETIERDRRKKPDPDGGTTVSELSGSIDPDGEKGALITPSLVRQSRISTTVPGAERVDRPAPGLRSVSLPAVTPGPPITVLQRQSSEVVPPPTFGSPSSTSSYDPIQARLDRVRFQIPPEQPPTPPPPPPLDALVSMPSVQAHVVDSTMEQRNSEVLRELLTQNRNYRDEIRLLQQRMDNDHTLVEGEVVPEPGDDGEDEEDSQETTVLVPPLWKRPRFLWSMALLLLLFLLLVAILAFLTLRERPVTGSSGLSGIETGVPSSAPFSTTSPLTLLPTPEPAKESDPPTRSPSITVETLPPSFSSPQVGVGTPTTFPGLGTGSTSPSAMVSSVPSDLDSSHPSLIPTGTIAPSPSEPSPRPSSTPSLLPSSIPSNRPSLRKTTQPSLSPAGDANPAATSAPTQPPAAALTPNPTLRPTPMPTPSPTPNPTPNPTPRPTPRPTPLRATPGPTPRPTPTPTFSPTPRPTPRPSPGPTPRPTRSPTPRPTRNPTEAPETDSPSLRPTPRPTPRPTRRPTPGPTPRPSPGPAPSPAGPTSPFRGRPFERSGEELLAAVEAYLLDSSSGTEVARTYGWPMNMWDVSEVLDFTGLFEDRSSFNEDISGWDFSAARYTNNMFKGASSFNQDVSGWRFYELYQADSMFEGATDFEGDGMSAWRVGGQWFASNLISASNMFKNAVSLEAGSLNNWKMAGVRNFNSMFEGCRNFNGDVRSWDVASAASMQSMFKDASSFSRNLCSWNDHLRSSGVNVEDMFAGTSCPATGDPVLGASGASRLCHECSR